MTHYEELDDRKILRAKDARVIEVRADPAFLLRLTGGLTLEFSGRVRHTRGPRGAGSAPPRLLKEFSPEELSTLISATPLSWVVFNDGDQRIIFSNRWHLTLEFEPGDKWRLDLGDGRILTYP